MAHLLLLCLFYIVGGNLIRDPSFEHVVYEGESHDWNLSPDVLCYEESVCGDRTKTPGPFEGSSFLWRHGNRSAVQKILIEEAPAVYTISFYKATESDGTGCGQFKIAFAGRGDNLLVLKTKGYEHLSGQIPIREPGTYLLELSLVVRGDCNVHVFLDKFRMD